MPGPSPASLAHNNTEDGHQAAIFCHFALPEQQARFPECVKLLFAIPNGGLRDKITAAKLKATGAKAGVSDMCLLVPRTTWHGMVLELKKIGGPKPRTDQIEFIQAARNQGFYATYAVGYLEAIEYLESYLLGLY